MEDKIISFFNELFTCLKKDKIKLFDELSNPELLYKIGLEIDENLFNQIDTEITGDDNLGIRISELTEISEIYLNILKPPEFIPTKKYKEEIELIDVIGLAKKEQKNIYYFAILIIITIFHCEKKEYFLSEINNINKDLKKYIFDLASEYADISHIIENKNKNNNESNINNNDIINYKKIIEKLEKELKLEKENGKKLKIVQEEYNNIKNKFINIESKHNSLLKELKVAKNRNIELEKIIEEKNNKFGILQNKLDEKIKLIKERRDTQLNKEIESNMELNFKIEEMKTSQNNDFEQKYKEELKKNEELKNEIIKLNDLIGIMEIKLNEKNTDDIETDMNNIRITEELEKKIKICEKEKEDLKIHFDKEFELMSSAIYNLGFQFWSLKCEDSEKLKQNENWLIRERIKQYNGDY